ncbi:catechol 2,3-dioxygenase-like lactoylglutathione lyase family enzyme [Xanthomonas campestris]|uniref:VOC family protein n=1 Tax=Xanthomonas euroxanthea TaxID=2259622 RepID=UPI000CEEDA32|nr:VOC family protein [Xanthomonas euroxanthea]NIJ93978.1 catechol 2,3-dioxygenase-like lactoylglutathione lyase family enzyme [Xanthomonas euroxanthea]NIK40082.1 catechol 2,3-dioxygenase-like lactoylglutathione lyase family enzyme [Xanthomonas euroxanthea]PPT28867.1 glyoxalase [Xanthomonas arboricola]
MALLSSQQLKVFVPARDYALSQRFYRALGFVQEDEVGNVTCFRHGTHCAFLLQDFYLRELAENLMLHLWVDDADSWWQHVHDAGLDAQFAVTCSVPEDRPWGARDFTLHDPSGVLWRIGHPL